MKKRKNVSGRRKKTIKWGYAIALLLCVAIFIFIVVLGNHLGSIV